MPSLVPREPLSPFMKAFRVLILMIPPLPSASYLDEGLEISSTFSMEEPSLPFRYASRSEPDILDGLPSIHTATVEPLSLILPSLSTVTPGELLSTSRASPVCATASSDTLSTRRSNWCSISGLFPDTFAPASTCASSPRTTGPISMTPSSSLHDGIPSPAGPSPAEDSSSMNLKDLSLYPTSENTSLFSIEETLRSCMRIM